MAYALASLRDLTALPHDTIIDVRSPAEFAEDHIPGAINLPALSNDERARVGTIYVRESRFRSRRIGAALVARNVASYLEGPLAEMSGGWKPLVYCWRGGQRSGSVATILRAVGWRADTLEGGWKAYRRLVSQALYEGPIAHPLVVIDGGTGSGKTALLAALEAAGAQVVDLEAMAEHRGSLFGPTSDSQPAQKAFETRLATRLAALDPARPVFIEAESSKIGQITLPPALWKAMRAAPRLRLEVPLEARVAHSVAHYTDVTANPARLMAVLERLARYHGHERVSRWKALAAAGDHAALARELIVEHYDPRYKRQADGEALALSSLSTSTLAEAAQALRARFDSAGEDPEVALRRP